MGKRQPRFTFIVFSKQQDANTQQFAETFQAAAEKRADRASFSAVDIRDQANQQTVDALWREPGADAAGDLRGR